MTQDAHEHYCEREVDEVEWQGGRVAGGRPGVPGMAAG